MGCVNAPTSPNQAQHQELETKIKSTKDANAPTSLNQAQQPETKVESTEHPTASNLNLVLYASGLYEINDDAHPNTKWAEGIKQSDFNTIILWTLHVESDGNLLYNTHKNVIAYKGTLQSLYGPSCIDLKSKIQELKSNGKVKRVLFSIGSAEASDWQNLYDIVVDPEQQNKEAKDNLYANFKVLVDLGIDGFDSDCEEGLTQQHIETHVTLFSHLYKLYPQLIFTFVPYINVSGWIEIAAQLYKKCRTQIVKFWCVQMYAGGDGNNVLQWIEQINKHHEALGLSKEEVKQYIIPGYWNNAKRGGDSPKTMRETFAKLSGTVSGGMLWNLPQTYDRGATLKAYSDAIIQGLKGGLK